jgi:RNA polymerase sigma factor (sigma-70 family)
MMDNKIKFDEKWNDPSVQSVMTKVSNRYKRNVDLDEIDSIKMDTLWTCVDKFDPTKGMKFTSYVYQQLSYAFKNKVKKKNVQFNNVETLEKIDEDFENQVNVSEFLFGLDEELIQVIEQRFYKNMTMVEIGKTNGYSRETARRRVQKAIKICKGMCD